MAQHDGPAQAGLRGRATEGVEGELERREAGHKDPGRRRPARLDEEEFDAKAARDLARQSTKKEVRDKFNQVIDRLERREADVRELRRRASRRERRVEELEGMARERPLVRSELQPGGPAVLLPRGARPGDMHTDEAGNTYKLTDDLSFVQVGGG